MKEVKRKKNIFVHVKICFEVYRIHYNTKKWVKNFQNSKSQLGGRGAGGSGQLGQKPTFLILFFFNPSLRQEIAEYSFVSCKSFCEVL